MALYEPDDHEPWEPEGGQWVETTLRLRGKIRQFKHLDDWWVVMREPGTIIWGGTRQQLIDEWGLSPDQESLP